MRDRETDSWWSIMTAGGIGGPLAGHDLVELPVGEKTRWSGWLARHPRTTVMAVDGLEHIVRNRYHDYHRSRRTYRNLTIDDRRLAPKEPVFSFHLDGKPYASPHRALAGGRLFEAGARRVFLLRDRDASTFDSTGAWRVDGEFGVATVRARVAAGELEGLPRLSGFDTYWYNWVAVHDDTELLQ